MSALLPPGICPSKLYMSLPEFISPFAFINSLPSYSEGQLSSEGDSRHLDFDEQVTTHATEVMTRNGDDISSTCERYFELVQSWLPIVDMADLFCRLSRLQTSPDAPFSILLLCICLYTKSLSEMPGRSNRVESLYYTAKCLHSLLQSTGRFCIELVQAGLLIAAYEHCQGLHEVSALSIGVCARLGYSLGLHQSLQQDSVPESRTVRQLEIRRRIWWSIFTLERYVHVLFHKSCFMTGS